MDSELYQMITERSKINNFGNLVGVKITDIKRGESTTELEIRKDLLNPIGTVHGGVICTIIDITSGTAVASLNAIAPTMSADIHFLNRVLPDTKTITGYGKVVKEGKRVVVAEVSIEDNNGRLIATATVTHTPIDADKIQ